MLLGSVLASCLVNHLLSSSHVSVPTLKNTSKEWLYFVALYYFDRQVHSYRDRYLTEFGHLTLSLQLQQELYTWRGRTGPHKVETYSSLPSCPLVFLFHISASWENRENRVVKNFVYLNFWNWLIYPGRSNNVIWGLICHYIIMNIFSQMWKIKRFGCMLVLRYIK